VSKVAVRCARGDLRAFFRWPAVARAVRRTAIGAIFGGCAVALYAEWPTIIQGAASFAMPHCSASRPASAPSVSPWWPSPCYSGSCLMSGTHV